MSPLLHFLRLQCFFSCALRKCLLPAYPQLANVHLRDYKVRVVNAKAESAAKVRVTVQFAVLNQADGAGGHFTTIGVNENIVDASWQAITDAFGYYLIEEPQASS